MKTFTKAVIALAVLGGGYAWYANEQKKALPPNPNPNPGPKPIVPDENAPLVERFIGAAEEGLAQPLIFLLHDEGSTPEEALKSLPEVSARVVAPSGRYERDGKRYFVNPDFSGLSFAIAMRKELTRLQGVLEDVIAKSQPLPKPYRAKVVGLGKNGAMAIGLGLYMPTRVASAWGTSGTVPTNWVPKEPQELLNAERPMLRKISAGAAREVEEATWKMCYERNYDLSLQKQDAEPTPAQVTTFLADLAVYLETA